MRKLTAMAVLGAACLYSNAWAAEEVFDACEVFTADDVASKRNRIQTAERDDRWTDSFVRVCMRGPFSSLPMIVTTASNGAIGIGQMMPSSS